MDLGENELILLILEESGSWIMGFVRTLYIWKSCPFHCMDFLESRGCSRRETKLLEKVRARLHCPFSVVFYF